MPSCFKLGSPAHSVGESGFQPSLKYQPSSHLFALCGIRSMAQHKPIFESSQILSAFLEQTVLTFDVDVLKSHRNVK